MRKMKALYLLMLMLAICVFISAQSQDWQWLAYSSGVANELCFDTAVDVDGNTWVVGAFDGDCQFGSFSHSSDYLQVFVAKADADGNWLWLKWTTGTSCAALARAVAVDTAGNCYVTGYLYGSVSFGSTLLTSAGMNDVFTAKLSPSGTWLWAKKAGETGDDYGYGIALDSYANVYVTGSSDDEPFIIVYTSSGAGLTGAVYPSTDYACGKDIAIDAEGNAIVVGEFEGSVTFGTTTLISEGYLDIFIFKITPTGVFDWVRRAGAENIDSVWSLCLDSVSSVYLAGDFYDNTQIGPVNLMSAGEGDIFVAKLSSAGTWLGAVRAGGTGSDRALGIAVESASAFYITGYYNDTASFGAHILDPIAYADAFVAKLNSAGTWLWAKGFGSTGLDNGNGLAIDPDGGLRLAGSYDGEMTVGNQTIPDAEEGSMEFSEVFLFKIGEVIPNEPENLSISMSGGDAILSWSPVTQTIYGQLVTPDEYIVYRSSTGLIEGPYTELGSTPGTTFTHEYVGSAEPRMFYKVSAYKY